MKCVDQPSSKVSAIQLNCHADQGWERLLDVEERARSIILNAAVLAITRTLVKFYQQVRDKLENDSGPINGL